MIEFAGHPMDHGWMPHKPETWPYKFARLKKPGEMWHYRGYSNDKGEPEFDKVSCEAGSAVKIVMVSRLGDVGITEDLSAENGYGMRVDLLICTILRRNQMVCR
jgi:hypothetical protein